MNSAVRILNAGVKKVTWLVCIGVLTLVGCSVAWGQQWANNGNNISNTNTANVGVGTPSPGEKLDVNEGNLLVHGSTLWTSGNLRLMAAGSSANWRVAPCNNVGDSNCPPNGLIIHQDAVGTRMTFTSGGNVGIGTIGPGYKLDVQGGQINTSGGLCIAGDCKTAWSQVGGSQWSTAGANAYFNTGNVGIGTLSPAYNLDVQGGFFHAAYNAQSLPASSAYGGLVIASNRSNGAAEVNFYNAFNNAPTAFQFSQKTGVSTAADLLTIMGNGNVGIGTANPQAKLDVTGNINVSGNINAKYQDVAEWVPSTQQMAPGTVVVLDTQTSNHVIASTREYDTTVAGVISEKPGISLGQAGEGRLLVATTGRVLIQVDASRAPIRVGDLLVTSSNRGLAMRSEPLDLGGTKIHRPGTLIGKALEPLSSGTGKILVLLSLQ